MKIAKFNRLECLEARGVAVVIDVIRAFTTTAYAFEAGIDKIFVVSTVEEAFNYRKKDHTHLLMGEVGGQKVEGFDYGNSPTQFRQEKLTRRTLVQRTTSGTQGVIAAVNATHILTSSFVVAQATLERIRALNPSQVSFIITGQHDGSEDLALADYLEACILGHTPDPKPFLQRVENSPSGRLSLSDPHHACCSLEDLQEALCINKCPFAMEVFKEPEGLTMRPVHPSGEIYCPTD